MPRPPGHASRATRTPTGGATMASVGVAVAFVALVAAAPLIVFVRGVVRSDAPVR